MKKLVSLIALTASLSLHASNPFPCLPAVKTQFFVLGMAKTGTQNKILTQNDLYALLEQEKETQRAQRQEQNAKQDAEPSNNKHKKWTTPKKRR